MELLLPYMEEIILLIGIAILRLFGRTESADKVAQRLAKKRMKRKKKLTKKCDKEAKQLEKDFNALQKLED